MQMQTNCSGGRRIAGRVRGDRCAEWTAFECAHRVCNWLCVGSHGRHVEHPTVW